MEKVYESAACDKVFGKSLNTFLDLLKFYSAPHLQKSVYLTHETEYSSVQNRTSIFVKTQRSLELTSLDLSVFYDRNKSLFNKLMGVSPVISIIDGTKFKSGEHKVRVVNASTVNGDVDSLLTKLGCRLK